MFLYNGTTHGFPWQTKEFQLRGPILSQLHQVGDVEGRVKVHLSAEHVNNPEDYLLSLGFQRVEEDWVKIYVNDGTINDGDVPFRKSAEIGVTIWHYLVVPQPDGSLLASRYSFMVL